MFGLFGKSSKKIDTQDEHLKWAVIDTVKNQVLPLSSMIKTEEEAVLTVEMLNSDPEEECKNRYYLKSLSTDEDVVRYLVNYR